MPEKIKESVLPLKSFLTIFITPKIDQIIAGINHKIELSKDKPLFQKPSRKKTHGGLPLRPNLYGGMPLYQTNKLRIGVVAMTEGRTYERR